MSFHFCLTEALRKNFLPFAQKSAAVIASGGAGKLEHFRDALTVGHADAALAATLFHFGILRIADLKDYLAREGVPVRRA